MKILRFLPRPKKCRRRSALLCAVACLVALLLVLDGALWENLQRPPTLAELRALIPNRTSDALGFDLTKDVITISPQAVNCSKINGLIAIVLNRVDDSEKRQFIRDTWGSRLAVAYHKSAVVFAVGQPSNNAENAMQRLEDESRTHGDILMGTFEDTYYNLTLKHLLILEWSSVCRGPKYFFTLDDDFLVFPENLAHFLLNVEESPKSAAEQRQNTIYCHTWRDGNVNRRLWHKNYISRKTYPFSAYPAFCRGFGRIMTADVPGQLLNVLPSLELLDEFRPAEDVLFTGLLRLKTDIKLVSINSLTRVYYNRFCITACEHSDVIQVGEMKTVPDLRSKWELLGGGHERHRSVNHQCSLQAFVISSLCRLLSDNF